ncbi:c-type cytochrome [Denitrificimonas caeni]|uniref:c-type cytochrome n=1 Tax=Denitrificimonas caeni TaxID=521720 RepID=UPI001962798B|nr:cytochrome c [Denitrificimonas caeni]
MLNKWIQGSIAAAMLAVIVQPSLANAEGDAAAGAGKITMCAACHGINGKSPANIYPHLAGQWAGYLESSLKAYRAGERTGGMSAMMTPQAAALTDQDIADIAAYYSGQ